MGEKEELRAELEQKDAELRALKEFARELVSVVNGPRDIEVGGNIYKFTAILKEDEAGDGE
jgi:hypothetical protein